MTSSENRSGQVEDYLRTHHVAMLATKNDRNSLWICTVYYLYSEGKLLFVSKTTSRHAQDIGSGGEVAVAITDTEQRPSASAHGLQATGVARRARSSEYSEFIHHYSKAFPKYSPSMPDVESLLESADADAATPYVLVPTYAKLVDKRISQDPIFVEFERP